MYCIGSASNSTSFSLDVLCLREYRSTCSTVQVRSVDCFGSDAAMLFAGPHQGMACLAPYVLYIHHAVVFVFCLNFKPAAAVAALRWYLSQARCLISVWCTGCTAVKSRYWPTVLAAAAGVIACTSHADHPQKFCLPASALVYGRGVLTTGAPAPGRPCTSQVAC